jgi:hypothetical protein
MRLVTIENERVEEESRAMTTNAPLLEHRPKNRTETNPLPNKTWIRTNMKTALYQVIFTLIRTDLGEASLITQKKNQKDGTA